MYAFCYMLYFFLIYLSFEKVHRYLFFLKRQMIEHLDRIHMNLDRMDSCTLKSSVKKIPSCDSFLDLYIFFGSGSCVEIGLFTNQKSMRFKAKTVKQTRGRRLYWLPGYIYYWWLCPFNMELKREAEWMVMKTP